MKKSHIVMVALLLLLTASLVLNAIMIGKMRSAHIMDYDRVGLYHLINGDITEMYVDEGNDPDRMGEFSDERYAQKICDILKGGCYQPSTSFGRNTAPGSGSYSSVHFTADGHSFGITVAKEKIRIYVDGSSKYYYSNIESELQAVINEILEEYFPK